MNCFDVVQLQQSQIPAASEIAANAFESDPVFSYLTPDDPALRFQALTWLTNRVMAYCKQYEHIYTTSDLTSIIHQKLKGD